MAATFQELGAYIYDSVEGYREAKDKSDAGRLQAAFATRLTERERTLARFNAQLADAGEAIIEDGSTLGDFHRRWLNVTEAIASGDNAVISAVEDGEGFLKERLEDALEQKDFSPGEREVIAAALEEVAEGEAFAQCLEEQPV